MDKLIITVAGVGAAELPPATMQFYQGVTYALVLKTAYTTPKGGLQKAMRSWWRELYGSVAS